MLFRFTKSKLPQEEVDALQQISSTMGATYWKFDGDSCQIEMVGITPEGPVGSERSVDSWSRVIIFQAFFHQK